MNDADRPIVPSIERIRSDGLPATDHVRLEPIETPWGPAMNLGEMMIQKWSADRWTRSSIG